MPKFIVKLCGKLTKHRFRKYRGCCDYSDIEQPVEYYYRCKICGYGFWNYNPPEKLEYKGYCAKIEKSLKENLYIGKVLGIKDSLNFHGNTIIELQEQFKICIDDYIEMCKYFKKTPEKEKRDK